ncbi:MAG: hypothetical protein LBL00_03435 [Endomicrobium sp.]|jgi:hypothetical protein|nr:hypothetical protein [Endomicrobium sp.]
MKVNSKILKNGVTAAVFCVLFCFCAAFAQEDYDEEFLRIEFEAEEMPKDELQNMKNQLAELEYYFSELKAQETKALAAIPANLKNKKFKSSAEKIEYYKKLSDEYSKKLANDQLSKNDIKVSQNLRILSELYSVTESIKSLKKEISKKQSVK